MVFKIPSSSRKRTRLCRRCGEFYKGTKFSKFCEDCYICHGGDSRKYVTKK